MWLYFSGKDVKNVYGYILVDALDNANPVSTDENFDGVEVELSKSGVSGAKVTIKNITFANSEERYYIYFSQDSSRPAFQNVTEMNQAERENHLIKSTSGEILEFAAGTTLRNMIEENKDVYYSIIKEDTMEASLFGKKLTKPVENKYTDAFYDTTHVTHSGAMIVTTYIHGDQVRKMQIKIGKITDTSILQKIKSQDVSGFSDLMAYAKKNNDLFDKVLDTNGISFLEYTDSEDNKQIDLTDKLEDKAYYYLYVRTMDENGKWVSNEGVTLALANVFPSMEGHPWYLFFYGQGDFKWADFGEITDDPTVAPTPIPQTGQTIIVALALGSVIVLGYYSYRRIKVYRDVK